MRRIKIGEDGDGSRPRPETITVELGPMEAGYIIGLLMRELDPNRQSPLQRDLIEAVYKEIVSKVDQAWYR